MAEHGSQHPLLITDQHQGNLHAIAVELARQPRAEACMNRYESLEGGGLFVGVSTTRAGSPVGGEVGGQRRVETKHARLERGQQAQVRRPLQQLRPALLSTAAVALRSLWERRKGTEDVGIGDTVKEAEDGEGLLVVTAQMTEGVGDARRQRRPAVTAGAVISSNRQSSGALEASQEVLRRAGFQVRKGQAHAQRVAVQPMHEVGEGLGLTVRTGRGVGGQDLVGVSGGVLARQPAERDAPHVRTQPGLGRTAGDDHRAPAADGDPGEEVPHPVLLVLRERRGGPARVGHLADGFEVVPDQQQLPGGEEFLDRGLTLRVVQERELVAEDLEPDIGDDSVQAEGGDTGFEGVPEHPFRLLHAAGVTPPPAEGLGQLGLSRPAGAVHHHDMLEPGGGVQGVEVRVPADELTDRFQTVALAGRGLLTDAGQDVPDVRRGFAGGAQVREVGFAARVEDGDHPVRQGQHPLERGPLVVELQLGTSGGDRVGHPVSGEQPLVERGHELGGGDREHAVRHRHHARAALRQQAGRHRGLHLRAALRLQLAGLAGVQHYHRHLRPRQDPGHPARVDQVAAAAGFFERQHPLRARGVVHHRPPTASRTGGRRLPEDPVAVEVHDLERLSGLLGFGQHLAEPVEGRWAQHHQIHAAAHRLQPSQQGAGDHLVADVVRTLRAGDHHQHPEPGAGNIDDFRHPGARQVARDRHAVQHHRHTSAGEGHQLPRAPQLLRRGGQEDDLHRAALGPRVHIRVPRRPRREHRREDLLAPGRQQTRDPGAPLLVDPGGDFEVLLQVPPQVRQIVIRQRPHQLHRIADRPRVLLPRRPRQHLHPSVGP